MKVTILITFLLMYLISFGYKFEKNSFQIIAMKSSEIVKIDGQLNEAIWAKSERIKDFWEHWPIDTIHAQMPTEIMVTYDDKNLYIGAKVYDDNSENIVQSLKRDNEDEYWESDGLALVLDPNNKGVNGYIFAVNAAGSQIEGLISQNGEWYKIDVNWNNSWESEIFHFKDHWTVEMSIPFKSISYNPDNHVWGINFVRNDMKRNNYSTWTKFSNAFQGIDLGHTGEFIINDIPESKKGNVILVPSVVGGISQNVEDNESVSYVKNLGLDSKINLGSSLRLDLTLNPDFSQVEVDEQITNLSRFNPFFPEKRNFFLENSDLFSNLGSDMVRPIFTRRIGIEDGENIPILFGARLSGNMTENARIGIMNVQTGAKDDIIAQNYTVATVQQSVLKRSRIKAFVANRQGIDDTDLLRDDYNRIGGAEFDFISQDGNWSAGAKAHIANTNEKLKENNYYSVNGTYRGKAFSTSFSLDKVNENYISDIGFIPRLFNYDAELDTTVRLGYNQAFMRTEYKFMLPESKIFNVIRPRIFVNNFYNDNGSLNESNVGLANFIAFKNKSWLFAEVVKNTTNLPYPITIINDSLLLAKSYENDYVFSKYSFDPRKMLSGEVFFMVGEFYDGKKYTMGGILNFRKQPWGKIGVSYTQNNVQLGEKYGNKVYHLVGPKAEISFSRDLAWTTFLQYNTQAENFNINTRLQWRFRPMSDFYLVFTNNYHTIDNQVSNYAITFKINFWINA